MKIAKIALIGATGNVGKFILEEAVSRGHLVTAITRHPERVSPGPLTVATEGDVFEDLAPLLQGHDAVISAFNPGWQEPELRARHAEGSRRIVEATKRAGVPRLLVIGGAGSLEVANGLQLVDSADFPEAWKPGALGARDALQALKNETELDWTFLSPAAMLRPGLRTGQFRLGSDSLLRDAQGESRISTQDLAVAMLDELENPRHSRLRFTVAY